MELKMQKKKKIQTNQIIVQMKKINKSNNAVVGVVTAILIIGVIVAVVSLIQTMYIPKIMEQREADHMDKVAEQFTYLTSVIDGQAANPTNNMPVATSITLGSKELPYMLSMKSFGTLEILDPILSGRSITIINGSVSKTYQIGVITYSSKNGYFLDQNYTYEAGAMIVSQYESGREGNMMMIRPSFSINNSGTLKIIFNIMNISSVGSKTIASGYGTYPIQTEFYKISSNKTFSNVNTITITTPFSNAWAVFFKSALGTAFTPIDNTVTINLLSPNTVTIRVINFRAQIGPGWVEQ